MDCNSTTHAISRNIAMGGRLVATDDVLIPTIWKLSPTKKISAEDTIEESSLSLKEVGESREKKRIVRVGMNTLQKTQPIESKTDRGGVNNAIEIASTHGIGG